MRFTLLLTLLVLFAFPAQAHRPYLIKEGTIKDLNGNYLILERLYGDGIFSADPVSFQVRTTKGHVVASTPTSSHVAIFCPTLSFCWAFPYDVLLPVGIGLKLDYESINWDLTGDIKLDEKEEEEQFKKYLSDKNENTARSYSFGYPEFYKEDNGFKPFYFTILISPLFIFFDKFLCFAALFILTLIPYLLHWMFFKKLIPTNTTLIILTRLAGGIIIAGYALFYCVALLILGFTMATPWLYMLGVIIVGIAFPGWLKKLKPIF